MNKSKVRKFCVAPMMGCTTPHARKLYRILSKRAFIFTEMTPVNVMLYSTKKHLNINNKNENPIAMQVGGADYKDLIKCTKIAKSNNFDEINLNVGCPSKAVQKGSFGVCLMNNKQLVRQCLEAMIDSADIEVSIKCRIGIGHQFNYEFFYEFINEIIKSGIKVIYVHARNAILKGFNPKNNRTIPPLNYNFISRIKNDFPHVQFILNGGIDSIEKAQSLSKDYDGVMIGRLIQNNPFCLSKVDQIFFNEKLKKSQNYHLDKIIVEYFKYVKLNLYTDSIFHLLSPLLCIFFEMPNNKKFKANIQLKMKNHEINALESLCLDFVNNQKEYTN